MSMKVRVISSPVLGKRIDSEYGKRLFFHALSLRNFLLSLDRAAAGSGESIRYAVIG